MSEENQADELSEFQARPYQKVKFNKYNPKDAYQKSALDAVTRIIYKIIGNTIFDEFIKNVEITRQFLHEGKNKNDLSVLFRYLDAGGSGGTYYYVLALKIKGENNFSYGIDFDTSERGFVLLTDTNTESKYKIIATKDRGKVQEYAFYENIRGYDYNSAE